jgi:hypothetical protein
MEMQKVLAKSHVRPMYSMVGGRDSAVGVVIRWGWAVRGSNPIGTEIFRAVVSVPKAHPAPRTVGTGDKAAEAWCLPLTAF